MKIEFLEKIKINNHLNRLINNYDTQEFRLPAWPFMRMQNKDKCF